MRVLLTGFTPMAGWQKNASEILVRSIEEEPLDELAESSVELTTRVFIAESRSLEQQFVDACAELAPDLCVFVGQARGRATVSIERFAHNILELSHPDASGEVRECQAVRDGGPDAYRTKAFGIESVVEKLCAAGVPARYSNCAGTSLCNQLLYFGLEASEREDSAMSCVFMHIPILPEQAIEQWPESPTMPLPLLRRAAAEALLELSECRNG